MRIPYADLTPATLYAVVQEFVTRDGTDNSSVDRRVRTIMKQLENGQVELFYDFHSETCNILTVERK